MKETQKGLETSDQNWPYRAYATNSEYVYRQLQSFQPQLHQENIQSPSRLASVISSSSPRTLAGYVGNASAAWTPTYSRMWPDTPSYHASATQPPIIYPLPDVSFSRFPEPQDFQENSHSVVGHTHRCSPDSKLLSQAEDMTWPSRLLDMNSLIDGTGNRQHVQSSSSNVNRSGQILDTSPTLMSSSAPTQWKTPLQELHDFHNRARFGQTPVRRDYISGQDGLAQLDGATFMASRRDEIQGQTLRSLGPVGSGSSSESLGSLSTFGNFIHPPCAASTTGSLGQGSSQGRQQQRQTEPEVRKDETGRHGGSEPSPGAASTVSAATASTASTTSGSGATPPWPSAPGFRPPLTGYEFELQHEANLRELQSQKRWARLQLSSCNENARFHHTQTTGCIVAVNGHIIGPYNPDSLRCYGTSPEVVGLRVTMTVHDGSEQSSQAAADGADNDNSPLFDEPTLVLRYQIVVPSRRGMTSGASGYPGQPSRRAPSSSGLGAGTSASMSTTASSAGTTHQQGRRRHFATTAIPLRRGIAARPGYRPLEAAEAVNRIRSWGGQPSRGVFGNAWLVRLAIEPGHVQHTVDNRATELLTGCGLGEKGGAGRAGWFSGGQQQNAASVSPTALDCMVAVNQSMKALGQRDGTLSIMLSNHSTQKRMARQCPDLVAMWVLAQENLTNPFTTNMLSRFTKQLWQPELLKIAGQSSNFVCKPHQVVDAGTLVQLCKTPIHGGLLANETGTGKPAAYLLALVMQQLEKERVHAAGTPTIFKPAMLVVPAAAIAQVVNEIQVVTGDSFQMAGNYSHPEAINDESEKRLRAGWTAACTVTEVGKSCVLGRKDTCGGHT
ncbi:hypothetical protein CMQ_1488 [Grosmannia clavigera kw1407]|uniref:Uncharacterized protein n=1 Tax=Grosmannia clavigera (strain kw1407 / UAMH 11150) TaxID=655863 RepID=F0XFR4_GROCL|nr:uncharacterized protein CMQ_1488 [Grosmannia clavigera kw1407]EFX04560.1 hypothetical protein CMQ_1488 [Grosmannia clavigera kw1407]